METNEQTSITEADRRINPFPFGLNGTYRSGEGAVQSEIKSARDFAKHGFSTTNAGIIATWGEEGLAEYREARREFELANGIEQSIV